MFETFIQTNSTKQNPFGSLNLNYQGEGISAWLLSSIAISIIFLTTIHNAHHQSGCNLQFWICHLQFINCNLHFSNCDLQFKNCNWLFTICKRYIFIATSPYPAISQVAAWYSTSPIPLLKPIRTCEIVCIAGFAPSSSFDPFWAFENDSTYIFRSIALQCIAHVFSRNQSLTF